jgi:hypothetical protein
MMKDDDKIEVPDLEFVEDYYELAQKELKEEQLLRAIEVLKYAETKLIAEEIKFKNKTNDKKSDYEAFSQEKFVRDLYSDNDLIYKCLDNYKQINKRSPDRSSDGIDNWFIKDDKLNSISICGRVTLNSTFLNMIAVFKEIDLLQKTIDSFEELTVVKVLSLTRWLARSKIKMPLTLTNRELYLMGFGIFLKKENMIFLPLYSPDEGEFKEIEKETKDYVRIKMNLGFYCVKYLDDKHCELFSCFNVDPKVSMVPWFVINNVTKEFGYYLMRDFRKAAEDNSLVKEYAERIDKFKEFYDFIRKALNINE